MTHVVVQRMYAMPVCYANVTHSALFICSQRQTFVLHKALTAGMRSEAEECAKTGRERVRRRGPYTIKVSTEREASPWIRRQRWGHQADPTFYIQCCKTRSLQPGEKIPKQTTTTFKRNEWGWFRGPDSGTAVGSDAQPKGTQFWLWSWMSDVNLLAL